MSKINFEDRCGCDQSIALERKIRSLEALIETMNLGHPASMDGELLTDGTFCLYPVGLARHKMAMGDWNDFKQRTYNAENKYSHLKLKNIKAVRRIDKVLRLVE